MPPGATVLAAAARPLGWKDPRWLSLLAIVSAALVLGRRTETERRPLLLALLTLAPPLAMGSIFGSPAPLLVAVLAGSFVAAARGRSLVAGLLAGVAIALDHRALLAVPFALWPALGRASLPRVVATAALAYALLVVPVALLDVGAFAARLAVAPPIGPGLGLANVFLYGGLQDSVAAHVLFAVAPAVLVIGVLLLLRARARPPALLGATAVLTGLWLGSEVAVEVLGVPLVLVGLGATLQGKGE
jgi:hypothetical protein